MTKKKFPKWFSQHTEPHKPTPPPENVFVYEVIKDIKVNAYSHYIFEPVPYADTISARVEIDSCDHTVESVTITFSKKKEVPNPHYKKNQERYLKDLEIWKIRKEEWKILKKEFNNHKDDKDKEFRRKQYEKLKKEFDDADLPG